MSAQALLPLVSIVTPSYNQAEYLEATIRSVLEQDYPRIEYIVVDGASTDSSVEIVRRYADRLSWWASEPDRGQAEAINKGFDRATGEIVAWLNSDDLYLPGAIAAAASALGADPGLGMVYGDAVTIDPAGWPLNRLSFGDWGLAELRRFRIICQPAVFMRRSLLDQAGPLDPSYHYMLDHHLWLRVAQLAPIHHIPALWAAARQHPAAKNVSQPAAFSRETLRLLDWEETQPGLAPRTAQERRGMQAGAYRLSARYLLEGGAYAPALRFYGRALLTNPRFALGHWHRMLYAALSLLGARGLAAWYYRLRQGRRPDLSRLPGLQNWPGLHL